LGFLLIACFSTPAKDYIKELLNPDPSLRPTAAQVLKSHVRVIYISNQLFLIPIGCRPVGDQWLTTHLPSTEIDLSGLRDHFDPRARWKSAILSTRALVRLHSLTKSSGGWKDELADSDDDAGETHEGSVQTVVDSSSLESNPQQMMDGAQEKRKDRVEVGDDLLNDRGLSSPSPHQHPTPTPTPSSMQTRSPSPPNQSIEESDVSESPQAAGFNLNFLDMEDELPMPGSFRWKNSTQDASGAGTEDLLDESWFTLLKKFTMRST
jgi:calcium/calmodulin-dependent protein kinase I